MSTIPIEDIRSYFGRLTSNPEKREPFIYDYLQGSGGELGKKFWSPNSSSRLAFDMFSWLDKYFSTKVVCFERQLPGVIVSASGSAGVPNMDVFVETDSSNFYIESKYTEKAKFDYIHGNVPNLSKAYWDNHDYGKKTPLSPKDRFYGRQDIFDQFSSFVIRMQERIDAMNADDKRIYSWFDAKQETCHLFGILFYLLNGHHTENGFVCGPIDESLKSKHHILVNVIYQLDGDEIDNIPEAAFPNVFRKDAIEMMNKVLSGDGFSKDCFSYEHFSYQALVNGEVSLRGLPFDKACAYGSDKTVKELFDSYKRAQGEKRNKKEVEK